MTVRFVTVWLAGRYGPLGWDPILVSVDEQAVREACTQSGDFLLPIATVSTERVDPEWVGVEWPAETKNRERA